MPGVCVAVVSLRPTASAARVTVAHASAVLPFATIRVLDVDGTYRTVGSETVVVPGDLGVPAGGLHRMAAALGTRELESALFPPLLRTADRDGDTVLAIRSGVLLLAPPTGMLDAARSGGVCTVARVPGPPPEDGRWPDAGELVDAGEYAPGLLALHGSRDALLDHWERTGRRGAPAGDGGWLRPSSGASTPAVLREPRALLTGWNLTPEMTLTTSHGAGLQLDGEDLVAVDLSDVDATHPWLLDTRAPRDPRGRLSDHPALARLVREYSAALVEATPGDVPGGGDSLDLTTTSLGTPVDTVIRLAFSTLDDDETPPDPFDPDARDELLRWLTDPAPHRGPGRYLMAVRSSRPDLITAFPAVPGRDTRTFLDWALKHAPSEGYPSILLEPAMAKAIAATRKRPKLPRWSPRRRRASAPERYGVNVVGYLREGFGLGESARLMVSALTAAGVPHSTVAVGDDLRPHRGGTEEVHDDVFDTTLLCVNADLAPAVTASLPAPLAGTHRVGMWYWEVEDFPIHQHGGFDYVHEVWAATEFIRSAVQPHSPVPVVTVPPPLPQRGSATTVTRAQLGLSERPYFLFTFDYLSTAERKNPVGLVDAFSGAFSRGEGPMLVIKSINADRQPLQAERLRLRVADEPDVVLLEDYLPAAERDALVAHCDCYVSLHRSEGLGLTLAEAMARGKPVIATGYSGNLDFMTEDNSFLVPWSPATIPSDAPPYPPGGTWADPDLTVASRMMRTVVDNPELAAARGARAAADIAERHSPEVAGRVIAARLAEIAAQRRPRGRRS
jgi:glycosyltransferase involved in cell wall biosynthesis